jgi:hypothetical protein
VIAPNVVAACAAESVDPEAVVGRSNSLVDDPFPVGNGRGAGREDPCGSVPTFKVEVRIRASGASEPTLDVAGVRLVTITALTGGPVALSLQAPDTAAEPDAAR